MDILWLFVPAAALTASLVYALIPRYHESRAERLLAMGRDRQAAGHLIKAQRAWARRHGENSLAAAAATAALARVRFIQGLSEQGSGLLEHAARCVFAFQGRPSRPLLIALTRLGEAAHCAGRFDEAMAIGRQALPIATRILRLSDPYLGAIHAQLGDAYAAQGLYEEAHGHYGLALEAYRLGPGSDSAECGTVLAAMATAMVREERWKEARELGLEAVEILDEADSAYLPLALGALAELHVCRGRLAEAEGLRLSICHLREKLGGGDSAVLAQEYELRADLLRRMERETEAEFLLAKSGKIRMAVTGA